MRSVELLSILYSFLSTYVTFRCVRNSLSLHYINIAPFSECYFFNYIIMYVHILLHIRTFNFGAHVSHWSETCVLLAGLRVSKWSRRINGKTQN